MRWTLERHKSGRLALTDADTTCEVSVVACFPWSRPHEFLSLRDDKGRERLFLKNLTGLDEPTQQLLLAELRRRNFVPRILTVASLTDEADLFLWRVVTDAGRRSFLTQHLDTLRRLPDGSLLIHDISNDVYRVVPAELDRHSLSLLWVYLD